MTSQNSQKVESTQQKTTTAPVNSVWHNSHTFKCKYVYTSKYSKLEAWVVQRFSTPTENYKNKTRVCIVLFFFLDMFFNFFCFFWVRKTSFRVGDGSRAGPSFIRRRYACFLPSDTPFNRCVCAGIVLLDGKTNDELEAKALTHANDLVDIYGGSWGPKDDGKTVDGPGVLGQIAFDIGATQVWEFNNVHFLPKTKRLTEDRGSTVISASGNTFFAVLSVLSSLHVLPNLA